MKSPKMLVKDLTDKSGPYSIKLKVINKTNAQTSPNNKSLLFQRITFEDEEGGKIKTTLYNDEIMAYEDVIHDRMEYEISDAKLKPVPEKYRTNVDDHPFQLSFTNNTLIQQIGSSPPPGPQYVALGSIPRALRDGDRYDALGILIYVDDVRQVPRQSGTAVDVCEIIIVDRSTAHPMIITVWADLVTKECAALRDIVQEFPIIGLTSLKPSYHKGFSLSTTTSTFIKLEPEGEMAESLRSWAKANHEVVEVKQGQVLKVRLPDTRRIITSIKNLRNKKASDTLQEERHWLHVSVPEFDRKDIRFYLGCNYCGTRSNKDLDVKYKCDACHRDNVTSSPRMNITFEAIDETGSFTFTAFTEDAEKLIETEVAALYAMSPEAKQSHLTDLESKIRATSIYIQVGPATSLSRNRVLKWVLKQLSLT